VLVDLRRDVLQRFDPAAGENDGRSFLRQQDGRFPSDAGSCTGDECLCVPKNLDSDVVVMKPT